ncbi:MAG: hypothetical protein AUH85_08440 [Chloroflexi bacterium 13_1_40CM_4_68_4]|nr:MAG: hypothetical protein AUH85_08440 [Chloroflexi bacterium 13_1_40CM_4_68_4]
MCPRPRAAGIEVQALGVYDDPEEVVPVAALERGLCREVVELGALLGRKGLVAEEVVEALAQTAGDDLEGSDGWPDRSALQLADEALG